MHGRRRETKTVGAADSFKGEKREDMGGRCL